MSSAPPGPGREKVGRWVGKLVLTMAYTSSRSTDVSQNQGWTLSLEWLERAWWLEQPGLWPPAQSIGGGLGRYIHLLATAGDSIARRTIWEMHISRTCSGASQCQDSQGVHPFSSYSEGGVGSPGRADPLAICEPKTLKTRRLVNPLPKYPKGGSKVRIQQHLPH